MARVNCSHEGEVQSRDPRIWSHQQAHVFTECHRVLKPEGLLAFRFHHSRAEEWAAIYWAFKGVIRPSFLTIRSSRHCGRQAGRWRPRNRFAERDSRVSETRSTENSRVKSQCFPMKGAETLATDSEAFGLSMSSGGKFVMAAAQTLAITYGVDLSSEAIHKLLTKLRFEVMENVPIL